MGLSLVRKYSVILKIKMPLLHHWGHLVMLVMVVAHRPHSWVGIVTAFFSKGRWHSQSPVLIRSSFS